MSAPTEPPRTTRATAARTTPAGTRLVAITPDRPVRRPVRTSRRVTRTRLWVVLAALVLVFGLLSAQLAELQVLNPDRYVATGERQRLRTQVLAADRGSILDRNGDELALSTPRTTVFTDPRFVAEPAVVAAALAPVLDRDERSLLAELAGDGPDDRFGYLARQVPDDVADDVRGVLDDLGTDGVYLTEEPTRVTPSGPLARSVVGEVDVDGRGISGIERVFGDELTGTPGEVVLETSIDGRTIPVGEHQERPAVPGDDVILTIDRSLQYEVERILTDQVVATGADGATAVVSDPATGEILAMATVTAAGDEVVPSGDNRAVSAVYEPGSVMKVVTVAGALEAGVVEPDTTFTVPDQITIADKTFVEHDPHGTVSWTVDEILAHSSNVGTIKIGKALGPEGIEDSYRRFGFGGATALGLPGEQDGVVPPAEDWWSTSIGTIPIGHGISATPLQVLLAYNTIANAGVAVPPTLVRGTVDGSGEREVRPLAEGRRVVSEETADELNLMLRDVVTGGTGKAAAVPGYTPAGKTGTARKVQPGGGYTNENGVTEYLSTFVGFVPAEDPAYSVIVVIDEPDAGKLGYTGGMVAAPAFRDIATIALRTGEVPPPSRDLPAARLGLDASVPDSDDVLIAEREPSAGKAVEGGSSTTSSSGAGAGDPVTTPTTTSDGRVRGVPAPARGDAATGSGR